VLLASRRGDRKTALPFGPFLIAGTLVAIFAGDTLAGWYPAG
jgi:leader peptidase (prepilin peptidase)/N-methyltransferase